MKHIVLEDWNGKYAPGSIVTPQMSNLIGQRGGATLPVEPELVSLPGAATLHRRSAVLGFFRRDIGEESGTQGMPLSRGGWPIPRTAGPLAPLVLYMVPNFPMVHWKAKVIALDAETRDVTEDVNDAEGRPVFEGDVRMMKVVKRELRAMGALRLTSESSQPSANGMTLAVDGAATAVLDTLSGPGPWYVGGTAKCPTTSEGYLGMSLFGHSFGRQLAVIWAAVSNTGAW